MGPKILIVDDCTSIQKSFFGMLQDTGSKIDCVSTGTEAISLIEKNPESYAIAFVDHNFIDQEEPYGRGDLICQRIREINSDIMTVIVSGDNTPESYKLWMKAGVDKVLYKPVTSDKLIVHVEVAFEKFRFILI